MNNKFKIIISTIVALLLTTTIALSSGIFKDVSPDKWYYEDVHSLYEKNIIGGFQDGTYRPDQPVTRAQMAKMLNLTLEYIENNANPTITIEEYDQHVIELVANATSSVVKIDTVKSGKAYIATGFIIEDNQILTNHHVIDNASSIEVTLSNGKKYEGTVERSSNSNDIAILSIREEDELKHLTLSTDVNSGQSVLVIGNPHSYNYSVTKGIVSHTQRQGKLQIDAGINGGNSGSPVISIATGKVVGIVTSKISEADNMAFAARGDVIQDFLDGNTVIYLNSK